MNKAFWLTCAALFVFVIAALSAFTASVNVNETGFLSVGLACLAAANLAGPAR